MNADRSRQIPLKDLSAVYRAAQLLLSQQANVSGADAGHRLAGFTATCVQCGIQLDSADLAHLAGPELSETPLPPKIDRVLKGYCARSECPSYYCRVEVAPESGIDWNQLQKAISGPVEELDEETSAEARLAVQAQRTFLLRWMGKLAAAAAILMLLLMIRQWYIGGTIPLLREPESFTIDPTSLDR